MASLNDCNFIGRLTRDPELKYGQSGKAFTKFSLAVDRQNAAKECDFFDCTAFEKTAEVIGQYTSKGSLVHVNGRMQNRKYTGDDGIERRVTELLVNRVQLLSSKKDTEENAGQPGPHAGGSNPAPRQAYAPPPARAEQNIDDMGMDDIPF